MPKYFLLLVVLLPILSFSQVVIKPGQSTVVTAEPCAPAQTIIIRDTVFVCPPTIPPTEPPPSTGTRQNIIHEDMFESADPKAKYAAQQQWCCSYSITPSKTIVGEGKQSLRFEHRGTENISGGYRVEFQSDQYFKPATELWYGYKMYFENFKAQSVNFHLPQWHPTVSGGSASLGIYGGNNTFHVRLNPEGDESAFTLKDGKKIENGRWYSFIWHVKWHATSGIVELWIDGEKYVEYINKPTLTRGGLPYFKFGLNRFGRSSSSMIFYADELRIGNEKATYKDVAPAWSDTIISGGMSIGPVFRSSMLVNQIKQ